MGGLIDEVFSSASSSAAARSSASARRAHFRSCRKWRRPPRGAAARPATPSRSKATKTVDPAAPAAHDPHRRREPGENAVRYAGLGARAVLSVRRENGSEGSPSPTTASGGPRTSWSGSSSASTGATAPAPPGDRARLAIVKHVVTSAGGIVEASGTPGAGLTSVRASSPARNHFFTAFLPTRRRVAFDTESHDTRERRTVNFGVPRPPPPARPPRTALSPSWRRDADARQRGTRGVAASTTGTGGGFERFCAGETDISNASRPINDDEEAAGLQGRRHRVHRAPGRERRPHGRREPGERLGDCLTTEQLKTIWEPGAEGKVTNWNQVDPSFPDEALTRCSAPAPTRARSTTSPTRSTARKARAAPTTQATEDDNVTVQGVAGEKGGLGYFGFTYYEENQDTVKAVEVDGGDGCVAPSAETAQDGDYTPLSRPALHLREERVAPDARGARRSSSTTSTTGRDRRAGAVRALTDERQTRLATRRSTRRRAGRLATTDKRRRAQPTGCAAARRDAGARTSSRASSPSARSSRSRPRSGSSSRSSSRRSSSSARSTSATSSPARAGRRSSPTREFGVLPLVVGTLVVTFWACLVCMPFGLGPRSTSASTPPAQRARSSRRSRCWPASRPSSSASSRSPSSPRCCRTSASTASPSSTPSRPGS